MEPGVEALDRCFGIGLATLGSQVPPVCPDCSGCRRSTRTGELTLTAIKPTFALAAGSAVNVGELLGSGRSRCLVAVWRCERLVLTCSTDPNRPQAVVRCAWIGPSPRAIGGNNGHAVLDGGRQLATESIGAAATTPTSATSRPCGRTTGDAERAPIKLWIRRGSDLFRSLRT